MIARDKIHDAVVRGYSPVHKSKRRFELIKYDLDAVRIDAIVSEVMRVIEEEYARHLVAS